MTPSESLGTDSAAVDTELDSTQTAEPIETSGEPTEQATEEVGGEEKLGETTVPAPAIIDGKALSPEAKAVIDEIQAKNPALAKEIRMALFQRDKYARELPGGLKEVAQMRQTIEDLGGDDGIRDQKEELTGWRDFDEKYMSGDAKVLDFLLEDPGGAEAFTKIAPSAFDRYAELDQPGFTHYICKTMTDHLFGSDIPLALARLGDAIPADNPVRKIFDQIDGYVKGIIQTGRTAPAAKQVVNSEGKSELDQQRAELEKEKTTLRRDEWQKKTIPERDSVFQSEIKQLLGNRQLSPAQIKAFNRVYSDELNSMIAAHGDKLNAYFNAKDENGFVKYGASLSKKYVPLAIRSALEVVMPGAKPGPKAAPKQTVPGTPGKPITPPIKGWEPVSGRYNDLKSQIDWDLTRRMGGSAEAGRVVLRGGKKVQIRIS